jgi:exonuclease III
MKIVTWNCQGAFAGKAERIFSGAPDIAVIQECSQRSAEMVAYEGYRAQWFGKANSKGLSVFYRENWKLRLLAESDLTWIVPFEVQGSENFTLIAVWACAIKRNRVDSYVGQIHKSLALHPNWFNSGSVVITGDFNSNAIWDKNRTANHSTMVRAFTEHGLMSAYHDAYNEEHGSESRPTFYLYRKPDKKYRYHLDYVFVPAAWRSRMTMQVGHYSDWSSVSDHCPLTVEICSLAKHSAQSPVDSPSH